MIATAAERMSVAEFRFGAKTPERGRYELLRRETVIAFMNEGEIMFDRPGSSIVTIDFFS